MNVQVEELGGGKKRLEVVIPAEAVESEWERVVDAYRKRAQLPGFRKGKAPVERINKLFSGDIEGDVRERLVQRAYTEALHEAKLSPAIPGIVGDFEISLGQPVNLVFEVVTRPQFQVVGFQELDVEQEVLEIEDADVDHALRIMQENRADFVPVERPAATGDVVHATIEGVDVHGKRLPSGKKEEVRMEVGSPRLLPEFAEAAAGIAAGESRMVEVNYPADFADPDLAGKTRRFRLTAQKIMEKKLPELDDNLARSMGQQDLDGVRSRIRGRLESEELARSRDRLESRLIEALLDKNPFEVPEEMVEYNLNRLVKKAMDEPGERRSEEEVRSAYRPILSRIQRKDILFENLVRQEKLELTDEEVEAQLEEIASEHGVDVSAVRSKMEEEDELERMRDTMQERKVLDFLISNAKVTRVRRPRLRPEGAGESRIIIP